MSKMYYDNICILENDFQLLVTSLITTFNRVEIVDHITIKVKNANDKKDFELIYDKIKLIDEKKYISYIFASFINRNRIIDFINFINVNKIDFQFSWEKEHSIQFVNNI